MATETHAGYLVVCCAATLALAVGGGGCVPTVDDGEGDADGEPAPDGSPDGDGDGDGDGGGDADADADADGDADAPTPNRERACSTEFAFRPDGIASSVQLAGEWDWSSPQEMRFEDGAFRAERDLPPGVHCYKLVVDGEWALDPANPYQAYCDGVRNSGARVPDRTLPLLTTEGPAGISSGRFTARVLFHAGCGGPGPAEVSATVRHDFGDRDAGATWVDGEWALEIDLRDLPPGKHTVVVEGRDEAGSEALPLLLPFWVEAEPFSWQDALIYMVMTDRFVNGEPDNDPSPTAGAVPSGDWHGGDIAGVTERIESGYFDALGVRALWLSPWNAGAAGSELDSGGAHEVTGYHGYWPVEPRSVDPRLGTEEELRQMVAAAHGRGIRVLMDLVVNHVHEDHLYFREHPEWFNDGCTCGTAGCDWTTERLTCLFASFMPDVDWRSEEASEQLIADALYWLEAFDLDGFRIDAVKHVDDLAVWNLATRVVETFETAGTDYYLDGETAMGWVGDSVEDNLQEYETISRYIGPHGLDGQFDFVLHHAVAERVFARGERGYIHLDFWTRQSQLQYPDGAVMTPFVGSHDSSRLISLCDYRGQDGEHPVEVAFHKWPDQGLPVAPTDDEPFLRARQALCWLLTVPGAPLLYMGDEHGEHGGGDPDNRHMMPAEADLDPRQAALLDDVRDLGSLRQQRAALRRGGYESLGSTETVLAFLRHVPSTGEAVAVVINDEAAATTHSVDLSGTPLVSAVALEELLGWGASASMSGAMAELSVPPRACAVFAPR